MLKEFREFIKRGNVVDLAVGVVVGGAFSKIVTSLVDNILTPIIGLFLGGVDFSQLSITIKDASIKYGAFIQSVIDFLIIAFCIFLFVRFINNLHSVRDKLEKKQPKKEVVEEVVKSDETKLLEEIRDLLKKKNK